MEWTIQHLARAAGTTSRTLRHYGDVGLLAPSRVGANGYRYYDEAALVRLQRILLLRDLGLGLAAIAEVLDGERDAAAALGTHLDLLRQDRERLDRQIASVTTTLESLRGGRPLMIDDAFDGFDHDRYREEVTERWGADAWERSDRWWRGLDDDERRALHQEHLDIARDYGAAHRAGASADDEAVQAIAARHCAWLAHATTPTRAYVTGLGEMYVSDPRFRDNYDRHAPGTAELVRDALAVYAAREL